MPRRERRVRDPEVAGTLAFYGPEDGVATKVVASVVRPGVEEDPRVMKKWFGASVRDDPRVLADIAAFFADHGVRQIAVTQGNYGCPHEEGIDFADGEDCPRCPFWKGRQGSAAEEEDRPGLPVRLLDLESFRRRGPMGGTPLGRT